MVREQLLSEQQKWGCFLACAYATGQAPLIVALESEAAARLTPAARMAAKSAATVMAMNTVYYRFRHMLAKESYDARPPRLRMTRMAQPATSKADFELMSLACGEHVEAANRDAIRPRLRAILERGLTADAAARWPSMDELVDAIATAAQSEP